MTREFHRTDRVGAQIQRELAAMISGQLDDPRLGMVTIQGVQVARDFSQAKVYFTTLGARLELPLVVKALNQVAPSLRHELGQRMRLRSLPRLIFLHDESVERGSRLSALIEEAVENDASHHPEQD